MALVSRAKCWSERERRKKEKKKERKKERREGEREKESKLKVTCSVASKSNETYRDGGSVILTHISYFGARSEPSPQKCFTHPWREAVRAQGTRVGHRARLGEWLGVGRSVGRSSFLNIPHFLASRPPPNYTIYILYLLCTASIY